MSKPTKEPMTLAEIDDLIYTAWGIIANAGEGTWERETEEWQDAAKRWRTRFHAYLDQRPESAKSEQPEEPVPA